MSKISSNNNNNNNSIPKTNTEWIESINSTNRCALCNNRINTDKFLNAAIVHINGKIHQKKLKLLEWENHRDRLNLASDRAGLTVELDYITTDKRVHYLDSNRIKLAINLESVSNNVRDSAMNNINNSIQFSFRLINRSRINRQLIKIYTIPAISLVEWNTQTGNMGKSNNNSIIIDSESMIYVKFQFTAIRNSIGIESAWLVFAFNGFVIMRYIVLSVIPHNSINDINQLAPSEPFNPNQFSKRNLNPNLNYQLLIPGEAPESMKTNYYVRRLPFYNIPIVRQELLVQSKLNIIIKQLFTGPITPQNYIRRMHDLLYLEENQMKIDICHYDRIGEFDRIPYSNELYRLKVPGLAESRPSLLIGDHILVGIYELSNRSQSLYQGFIHRVDLEHVEIHFNNAFSYVYIPKRQFYIRFTFNRIPIRRAHLALELVEKQFHTFQHILFPKLINNNNPPSNSNKLFPDVIKHLISLSTAPADKLLKEYYYLSDSSIFKTRDPVECNDWIECEIINKSIRAIGFDTEGQPELSTIQLSTDTHSIVYANLDRSELPLELKKLLEDSRIIKFAFDSRHDIKPFKIIHIHPQAIIDVQAAAVKRLNLQQKISLKDCASELLSVNMSKPKSITMSNWMMEDLTANQIMYAAADSYITLQLAKKLNLFTTIKSESPQHSSNSTIASISTNNELSWFNRQLNAEQHLAVTHILSAQHKPYPYIIIGPPGTGKTSTLVESIKQVYFGSKKLNKFVRILCIAPSNSATDLLIERLSPHIETPDVRRLNAPSRSVSNNLSLIVRKSSYLSADGRSFVVPPLTEILRSSILVSTSISGGILYAIGLNENEFTHIFVDEAGHSEEPELLVSLAGVLNSNTSLILTGDPKQLGPIIRSPIANQNGLQMSLIERLMQPEYQNQQVHTESQIVPINGTESKTEPKTESPHSLTSYSNQTNPRYITHLLHNYRSHPSILTVPNELFYHNRLLASADQLIRQSLCRWPEFPNQNNFPILFHSIVGVEQREANSPSFFNSIEAVLVVDYVKKLLNYKLGAVKPDQIGIITPYRKQCEKIKKQLSTLSSRNNPIDFTNLRVGSVEEFQGQERRIIIISTVRSQSLSIEEFDLKYQLGFVKQSKRMNVAITRAQAALIIIGNADILSIDANWRKLIKFSQSNKAFIGKLPTIMNSADTDTDSNSTASQLTELLREADLSSYSSYNNNSDNESESDDPNNLTVRTEEVSWKDRN